MVEEAVELAEIELRRRNVRLSHYVAARLPKLHVDPILIEQVLVNLLKNAAEAIDMPSAPRRAQRGVAGDARASWKARAWWSFRCWTRARAWRPR
jgi:C4-dicarboxylate-specific signal transduction histidine kinase